jgi:hypothetical protein
MAVAFLSCESVVLGTLRAGVQLAERIPSSSRTGGSMVDELTPVASYITSEMNTNAAGPDCKTPTGTINRSCSSASTRP